LDGEMKISAIGLNWISTSSILAFSRKSESMQVYGWDPDLGARVAGNRNKVFQRVSKKLRGAVKGAKIIFFGLGSGERSQIFKKLAVMLQHGSVLVNLFPPYKSTNLLFREILGSRTNLISIYPTIKTKFFLENDRIIDNAREDLFMGCPIYIADDGNMDPAILDLAVDIVVLLGGYPVFISQDELDGFVSSTSIFPQLLSAEMIKIVSELPGWRERRQTANVDLFQATLPVHSELNSKALAQQVVTYRENLLLILDAYLRSLVELRNEIDESRMESIYERLKQSIDSRNEWLGERSGAEVVNRISAPIPTVSEALKSIARLDN